MRVYWHSLVVALNIGKGFEKDLHKSILDTSLLKNRISIISLNRLLFSNGNRIGHNRYSHQLFQSDLWHPPEDLGNDPRRAKNRLLNPSRRIWRIRTTW
jgi:hypothetical protein